MSRKIKAPALEIVPDQKTDFSGWLAWKLGVTREQLERMRAAIPEHTATAIGLRERSPETLAAIAKTRATAPALKQKDLDRLASEKELEERRRQNAVKAAAAREKWLNDLKQNPQK